MSCAPGVGPAGRLLPAQASRHLRTLVTWGRPELHFDAVAEFRQRLRQLAVALDLLGRPVDRGRRASVGVPVGRPGAVRCEQSAPDQDTAEYRADGRDAARDGFHVFACLPDQGFLHQIPAIPAAKPRTDRQLRAGRPLCAIETHHLPGHQRPGSTGAGPRSGWALTSAPSRGYGCAPRRSARAIAVLMSLGDTTPTTRPVPS